MFHIFPTNSHQIRIFAHLGTKGNHFQLASLGLDRVPVELWIIPGVHIPREVDRSARSTQVLERTPHPDVGELIINPQEYTLHTCK